MSFTQDEWYKKKHEAPFYDLLSTVNAYLHPEVQPDDELFEMVREHPEAEWVIRFKDDHRAALLEPGQLPDGALSRAAGYDDGNDVRFLRRLWRDLYPNEPVPGGDEEFREDLRKLIRGEITKSYTTSTIRYYNDLWPRTSDVEKLKDLGRRIWRRFYPDEPPPEST